MYRFRHLDTQNLTSYSLEELSAMLSIAYGDIEGLEEHSLDRIRILIGIREITAEISRRAWAPHQPEPPRPGR
jgi:hypothetical protein